MTRNRNAQCFSLSATALPSKRSACTTKKDGRGDRPVAPTRAKQLKETTMPRKIKMISGDSHLDFPPERWTQRMPAKWRDRAPRRIKLANGDDAFIIEN